MSELVTRIPRSERDWIYTAGGRKFWPLDPRPEEIFIEDIAKHLSATCRFLGACEPEYSVAEHSVRVMRCAELQASGSGMTPGQVCEVALWGLLHDAPEAYLCDLVRPMKASQAIKRVYRGFEAGLEQAVCARFGLAQGEPLHVRWADEILLATEFRDLMSHCEIPEWLKKVTPLPDKIVPLATPDAARRMFLAEFERLTKWRVIPQ